MDFRNKKVVIMGLGLHGGGLAAAKWFYGRGAHVVITDMKTAEQLRPSLDKLSLFIADHKKIHPNVHVYPFEFAFGGHRKQDFCDADLVLQNPGVPRESEYLALAREQGIAIENEATIFFQLTPGTFKIGITGTRGKSTTSMLIHAICHEWNPRVMLAGVATHKGVTGFFDILDEVMAREAAGTQAPVILELSSWQLELFHERPFAPQRAVITNVLQDHLNRYTDFNEYATAKSWICQSQQKDDCVILNYDNNATRQIGHDVPHGALYWFSRSDTQVERGGRLEGDVLLFRDDSASWETVCDVSCSPLIGDHNKENILAAVAVAKTMHIPNELIQRALMLFKGVPDRLEFVTSIQGRDFFNDTTATSPDATRAAITSLAQKGRGLVLIAGGADKNLIFDDLAAAIPTSLRTIILLGGTASPKLAAALKFTGYPGNIEEASSMKEAVEKAWKYSQERDIILLSPGAASFGMFIHEFDRGLQYIAEIESLAVQRKAAV